MEILYQDNRILVCIKPSGVVSTDEPGGMPQRIRDYLGDAHACVRTVHRLDAAVAGVMVLARSRMAAELLSEQVRARTFEKEYLAVLTKRPEEDAAELHDLLFHDRFKNKTFVVSKARKGVKKASLSYRVLEESNGRCLVHVRLYTGRTHQIRVQCASRGCPLVGDGKYGSRVNAASPALWSYALTIPALKDEEARFCALPEIQGAWEPFSDTLSRLEGLLK